MVKIIMHGCNGHMGQVITGLVKEDANAEIIAGIDMNDNGQNDYPVFKSLAECDVPADVVVDFSSYKAADALLDACKEKKLPLVLCTTGLTEDQLKKVQETSKEIPDVYKRQEACLAGDWNSAYDVCQFPDSTFLSRKNYVNAMTWKAKQDGTDGQETPEIKSFFMRRKQNLETGENRIYTVRYLSLIHI